MSLCGTLTHIFAGEFQTVGGARARYLWACWWGHRLEPVSRVVLGAAHLRGYYPRRY